MKKTNRGYLVPILIIVIAILAVGWWVTSHKDSEIESTPSTSVESEKDTTSAKIESTVPAQKPTVSQPTKSTGINTETFATLILDYPTEGYVLERFTTKAYSNTVESYPEVYILQIRDKDVDWDSYVDSAPGLFIEISHSKAKVTIEKYITDEKKRWTTITPEPGSYIEEVTINGIKFLKSRIYSDMGGFFVVSYRTIYKGEQVTVRVGDSSGNTPALAKALVDFEKVIHSVRGVN